MKEAILYKKLKDNAVQCQVCHHNCIIKNNQRGICSVRENQMGKLYALNYRRAISEAIDPIEKKPFFHFLPGSLALSIATLGCNFRCDNCQNWQISQSAKSSKKEIVGEDISPNKIVDHAMAHNCVNIAYTYTEPTIFLEYAYDTMVIAANKGIKNVWVSNGYMSSKTFNLIVPYLDAVNIDLKFMDDKSYVRYCGGKLQPVLDNIVSFKKKGVWVEITTLSIPGLSDSDETFKKISKFIYTKAGSDTPWHISRFTPEISYKLNEFSETSIKTLEQAYKIGTDTGLKYVYLGNVPGHKAENTYCPKCHKLLIERLGYQIRRFDKSGMCYNCNTKIDLILK